MIENEILETIFISLNNTDKVIFSYADINNWPEGVLDRFINSGLLEQTSPAKSTYCDGCEQNCIMPVEIRPPLNKLPARAFVACDKRDDKGRISVELESLQQWQITTENLAKIIARLLSFNSSPRKESMQSSWHIGTLKGDKKKDSLLLISGKEALALSCGGHTIDVIDVLACNKRDMQINKNKLLELVNNSIGSNVSPLQRRDYLKKRIAEEKKKGNKAFNKTVADEAGISISRLQQIIKPKPKETSQSSAIASKIKR